MSLRENMRGRWSPLLMQFGISAKFLRNKHGPCPLCGGKDRFRFDDKDGLGTWICSHCGAGDGMSLLMKFKGWDYRDAAIMVEPWVKGTGIAVRKQAEKRDVREELNRLWKQSRPITLDHPAGKYLNRRCGLTAFPACLRAIDDLPYWSSGRATYHPAMLAQIVDVAGKPVALHRTFLTDEGQKASVESPRRILGSLPSSGGAVRLAPVSKLCSLGVAEGIETALSASAMLQVPVWSLLNTSQMVKFEPPAGLEELLILGDNDPSFAGQRAAYTLAERLAGRTRVSVILPSALGSDWNDVHQKTLYSVHRAPPALFLKFPATQVAQSA